MAGKADKVVATSAACHLAAAAFYSAKLGLGLGGLASPGGPDQFLTIKKCIEMYLMNNYQIMKIKTFKLTLLNLSILKSVMFVSNLNASKSN